MIIQVAFSATGAQQVSEVKTGDIVTLFEKIHLVLLLLFKCYCYCYSSGFIVIVLWGKSPGETARPLCTLGSSEGTHCCCSSLAHC